MSKYCFVAMSQMIVMILLPAYHTRVFFFVLFLKFHYLGFYGRHFCFFYHMPSLFELS